MRHWNSGEWYGNWELRSDFELFERLFFRSNFHILDCYQVVVVVPGSIIQFSEHNEHVRQLAARALPVVAQHECAFFQLIKLDLGNPLSEGKYAAMTSKEPFWMPWRDAILMKTTG